MNKILIVGRLTRDPEVRYTPSGKAVANFTVAVDRPFKNAEGNHDADFIDAVAWNKLAEIVGEHLRKGQQVAVEGRIQIRSYDASDGTKRKACEVVADNVEFLAKPRTDRAPADAQTEEVPF